MAIDVTVLRVFTDSDGKYGNPLGVVDNSTVAPGDRQRIAAELGYSETVFIDLPQPGGNSASAHIFTPVSRAAVRRAPDGRCLVVAARNRAAGPHPAGARRESSRWSTTDDRAVVNARSEWAPEFAIYDLASVDELLAADPDDFDRCRRELPVGLDRRGERHLAIEVVRPAPGDPRR